MQQLIRYLYEYKDGKKVRNVGFAKVEKEERECVLQIYGKGVEFGADKKIEVFIFYLYEDKCVGYSQGFVQSAVPTIHFTLRFDVSDVEDEGIYDQINGIILHSTTGKCYAAAWDESEIFPEQMIRAEELHQPAEDVLQAAEDVLQAEETPEEYVVPKDRVYEKIGRQDLARLPRKEWRLANNSFLLHGYYNYHHLLYIEEDGNVWIGVPGIFHEKEQDVAKAFGFPQFHRVTDGQVELGPEETNTYEDFGYWCRAVIIKSEMQ